MGKIGDDLMEDKLPSEPAPVVPVPNKKTKKQKQKAEKPIEEKKEAPMPKPIFEVYVDESRVLQTSDEEELEKLEAKLKKENVKYSIKEKTLFEEVPQDQRQMIK